MVRLDEITSVCPCGLKVLKKYYGDQFHFLIGYMQKTKHMKVKTCKEMHNG